MRGAHGRLLVGRVESDRLGPPAAVHVAAELLPLGDATHGGDHPIAHDEGAHVAALALGDELLHQHVLPRALERLDDGGGHVAAVGEDDADALGAFEELDDDGRAAHPFDGRPHVGAITHERRAGDADLVAAEDLQAAQLVARVRDTGRGVGAEDVHLLELPDDGGTEVGDGSADAREHRVVVADLLAAEEEVGGTLIEVDGEAQRVEHLYLVTARPRGLHQPSCAVAASIARQDRQLHRPLLRSSPGAGGIARACHHP